MPKSITNLSKLFGQFHENVIQFPVIAETLAEKLGVTTKSVNKIGLGYYPLKDCWVIPERDQTGKIVGLFCRNRVGKKWMVENSQRGLYYPWDGQFIKRQYQSGKENWVRTTKKYPCPLCGKSGECLLSVDNPGDPSAVCCAHVSAGAVRRLRTSWLHILKSHKSDNSLLSYSDKPLLVCEGHSDTIKALDLGYLAVGRASALDTIEMVGPVVQGRSVIIVGDNGEVGHKGAFETYRKLRAFCPSVQLVFPPVDQQDLRSWNPSQAVFQLHVEENAKKAANDRLIRQIDYKGLAERLLRDEFCTDAKRLFHYFRNDYYVWNQLHYKIVNETWLDRKLYQYFDGFEILKTSGQDRVIVPLSLNINFLKEVKNVLRAQCLLDVPEETPEPFYINGRQAQDLSYTIMFANGMLNIQKGTFEPLTPEIFSTSTLPFKYDPKATCPRWNWFVQDIFNGDQECVDLLCNWFGYSLLPLNIFEQFLFLYGAPGSGKGTVVSTLEAMLGEDKYHSLDFNELTSDFGRQPLVGKHIVTISEEKSKQSRASDKALATIKRISGRDTISINRKHKPITKAKLFCRIIYSGNNPLEFRDDVRSLSRRLSVLHFANDCFQREGGPDVNLKSKLRGELPGILNWSLVGLKQLLDNQKFIIPKASREYLKSFQEIMNPLLAVIEEHCEVCDNPPPMEYVTKCSDLHELYKGYCVENKIVPDGSRTMGLHLKSLYPFIDRKRTRINGKLVYAYHGVRIKPDAFSEYLL